MHPHSLLVLFYYFNKNLVTVGTSFLFFSVKLYKFNKFLVKTITKTEGLYTLNTKTKSILQTLLKL